jgi:prophage regulatory protein
MSTLERNRRLRLPEVMRLTGLSKTEVYRRAKDGRLPKPYRESHRVSYWIAGELSDHLTEQPREIEALLA